MTLAAELFKLRTIRAPYALLAVALAFGLALTVAIALTSEPAELTSEVGARLTLSTGGNMAGIMALLLGIIASGGEYRHGTILPTLFVTPDRGRVALANAVASAAVGGLIGAVAVVATGAVGLGLMAAREVTVGLSDAQLVGIAVGGVAFPALSAAFGSALGTLVRSQVAGISIALLALFVVEPVLTELVDGYQRYSLTGVRVALVGGEAEAAGAADGGLPPAWLAALLWTGYTVALVTAAITVTRRRDV
jgi:ABC-2 type transport system permease protein